MQALRSMGDSPNPRSNVYQASKVIRPLPGTHFPATTLIDVGPCERRQQVSIPRLSSSLPRESLFSRSMQRARLSASSAHQAPRGEGRDFREAALGQIDSADFSSHGAASLPDSGPCACKGVSVLCLV